MHQVNVLGLVQQILNLLRVFQIGLQYRGRGGARKPLADDQTAGVLEGVEDLAAQEAGGAGDENIGRHGG